MHETGLSKETQAEYDKWNDPQYMSGFTAGCDATTRGSDEKIAMLEERVSILEQIRKELNGELEICVLELHDLKQPWYVKLWKKVPRISINIERGA